MKRTPIALFSFVVACMAFIYACKSNSSNPTGPSAPPAFSFAVGNRFQFDEWSLDSNGNKIPSSFHYVNETFVDSGKTVDNQSNVYIALDSSLDTSGNVMEVDTVYTVTDGKTISVHGLIAKGFVQNGSNAQPKWNKIVDVGNTTGWLTDTTATSVVYNGIPIPITEQTNGVDSGNVTLAVGSTQLLCDHASHHGKIYIGIYDSLALMFDAYASYSPTVIAKSISAPMKAATVGLNIQGSERDLVSWQVK